MSARAKELRILCNQFLLPPRSGAIPSLQRTLQDPRYTLIHHDLLLALLHVVENARDETTHGEISDPFMTWLENTAYTRPSGNMELRATAIKILSTIVRGEDGFQQLLRMYMESVEAKSPSTELVRDLLLELYPAKRVTMMARLYELMDAKNELFGSEETD